MIPTVKTLQSIRNTYKLPVDLNTARRLRKVLENAANNGHYYNDMCIASNLLGYHGVEVIASGKGTKSPRITYVNTGDTYATTLLFIHDIHGDYGRFVVGDWGSIVERGNYA